MENVSLWLMSLFDSPEAILCIVYFAVRLIYFLCTGSKRKKEKQTATEQANEVKDIYVATAQLYKMIQEERAKNETKKS